MSVRALPADTHNNFNLVRLVLAGMVVAYHLAVLSSGPAAPGARWLSVLAELGVQGFFVLSGYLVWLSFERTSSLGLYIEKRVRRLLPAYAAVIILSAIGALALGPAARADLAGVGRYVGWNLLFLNFMEPRLPGVFEGNPTTEVNGALWTLKIEVMFYLVLPVLAWVLRQSGRARWVVLVLIYVLAEAWRIGLEAAAVDQPALINLSRQLPGQMAFFVTGIALAAWRERLDWRPALPLAGVALLALTLLVPGAEFVRPLGVGILAVWIAVGTVRLPDAARFGDISYGLYIVHFPIIQCAVTLNLFAANPWLGVAASATTSVIAALLLWHFVEKPALRRDSAYRTPAAQ